MRPGADSGTRRGSPGTLSPGLHRTGHVAYQRSIEYKVWFITVSILSGGLPESARHEQGGGFFGDLFASVSRIQLNQDAVHHLALLAALIDVYLSDKASNASRMTRDLMNIRPDPNRWRGRS